MSDWNGLARSARVVALLSSAACGGPPRVAAGPPPVVEADLGSVAVRRGDTSAPDVAPDRHPELDPERAALDARHADVARCYETALARAPSATGVLVLETWFTAAGEVQRARVVSVDPSLQPARACFEQSVRGAAMQSAAPAGGVHAHRRYTFTNPAISLAVTQALPITPGDPHAPPPPRAHAADEGAAVDAGVLRAFEVVTGMNARLADLQACYATVLRHAATAEGSAMLHFDVAPDGSVASAAMVEAPEPLDRADDCVATALRTLRFRATGTATSVRYPVSFARRFWAAP